MGKSVGVWGREASGKERGPKVHSEGPIESLSTPVQEACAWDAQFAEITLPC